MLKNRYDVLCLGQTPWSLMHAIVLRSLGQDVLVVDDPRWATEAPGTRWLTMLETMALRDLGERYGIGALRDLDPCLRAANLRLSTPRTSWASGDSVRDNLTDWMRKLSFLNTPVLQAARASGEDALKADLQRACTDYLAWLRSPPVRQRARPAWDSTAASWINEFHRLCLAEHSAPYEGPEIPALTQLLTAFASALGSEVKYRFGAHELWPLVLRMLSPVVEKDHRWMEHELARELSARGGQTKLAGVRSWQFYRGHVEAALLDSYEGVVCHGRLLLHGFPPDGDPLQCSFAQPLFMGLRFVAGDINPDPFEASARPIVVGFTSSPQLGTDIPAGVGEAEGPQGRLIVLAREVPGGRPEFARDAALTHAQSFMAPVLPGPAWSAARFQGRWGRWIEDLDTSGEARRPFDHHARRTVRVLDRDAREELAGVEFAGPLRSRHLGLLGFVTDLHVGRA